MVLPTSVLLDAPAAKVVAEAENGAFAVLPRHVDFLAALRPGVLAYTTESGPERFVGHDVGIFVKCAGEVRISTGRAFASDDLGALRRIIDREFMTLDDHERTARSALARLEAGMVRRLMELEEQR